jgi:CheY-like chemotaxis protein
MTELAGKTVLYYEDQPLQLKAIIDLLRHKLRMEVLPAETPAAAIQCVVDRRLDLILLDIRIRGDSQPDEADEADVDWRRRGLYFLRDLRAGNFRGKTPKEVPVLVITCVVNTVDVDEILAAGNANGCKCLYLAKPVRLAPVEKAVRILIG